MDNRKTSTLNQEKVFKAIQEKIVNILGPVSKLWSTMEEERDSMSPETDDSQDNPLNEISTLFEQTYVAYQSIFQFSGLLSEVKYFIDINR